MKKGFTVEKKNFYNISLGQGQEKLAEDAIELGSQMGNWVMLQVIMKFHDIIMINSLSTSFNNL